MQSPLSLSIFLYYTVSKINPQGKKRQKREKCMRGAHSSSRARRTRFSSPRRGDASLAPAGARNFPFSRERCVGADDPVRPPRRRRGYFSRTECAGNDSAPFSLRGKEKAAGGKKKTAKGEFRFSPFAIPCKTTKKGVTTPFLDFSQEFGLCDSISKPSKTR